MHTLTVTVDGAGVFLLRSSGPAFAGHLVTAEEETPLDEGPSPIAPEVKEILWGFGAFIVLLIAMRLYLVPKLKRGMAARYGKIRNEHESAEATREAAKADVGTYESQLASVRAEASARIDETRQVLERERADRLAVANEQISERRSAAATEVESARRAAASSVEDAAVTVASRVVELSTGRRPDETTVRGVVSELTNVGARS